MKFQNIWGREDLEWYSWFYYWEARDPEMESGINGGKLK